jgi:hypothetical protein
MKVRSVAALLKGGVMSVVVGCGGAKPEARGATPDPSAQAAQPKAASVASGEVGIPECDNYTTKYRECIEAKIPDSVKGTTRQRRGRKRPRRLRPARVLRRCAARRPTLPGPPCGRWAAPSERMPDSTDLTSGRGATESVRRREGAKQPP